MIRGLQQTRRVLAVLVAIPLVAIDGEALEAAGCRRDPEVRGGERRKGAAEAVGCGAGAGAGANAVRMSAIEPPDVS